MQQTLCAIPVEHVGRGLLFITLTYPREYPGDWRLWKRQLDTMSKRLARKFPRFGAVWKLEPQMGRGARGLGFAPHFHLVVVGLPYIAKSWLSESWYNVVGSRDPRHLVAGTQVQLARSHRGVVSYAAKYAAKKQSLPHTWDGGVGRWWGVFGRGNLGIIWLWAPISQPEFFRVTRVLRALISHRYKAVQRGPPRSWSSGMWAVLDDKEALRLLRCFAGPVGGFRALDGHVALPVGAEVRVARRALFESLAEERDAFEALPLTHRHPGAQGASNFS
jgi:hypothetical protein